MIDDIRTEGLKHLEDLPAVPDRADDGLQLQLRIFLFQLQLNVIGVVFVNIEENQLFRLMCGNLSGQFGADGSHAGHQHHLPGDPPEDFGVILADGLSSQQILDLHRFHLADHHFAGIELVDTRQIHQLTGSLAADLQDGLLLCPGCAGNGHVDLPDAVFLHGFGNALPSAHHRHAVNISAPLVGVVIDDGIDHIVAVSVVPNVPQDHPARFSGAHQQYPACVGRFSRISLPLPLQQHEPVGKPDSQSQQKLDHDAEQIVG